MSKFNYVLFEDPMAHIVSFKKSLNEIFPQSSILRVTPRNFYDCFKLKDTTPLLTKTWLIYLSSKLSFQQCARFFNSKDDNVVVLEASLSKRNETIIELSALNVEFQVVDNVRVSKEKLVSYTMEQLGLEEKDAKTLCNRSNYYLPYVVESINILKSLGTPISRKEILKFVDKRNTVRVMDLFFHILGYNQKKKEQLAVYLYDFRYAFDYIKKKLLELFDDCILVYTLVEQGIVGLDNYRNYDYERKLVFRDYHVKLIINELHSYVSLEALISIRYQIIKCDSMFKLLYLVEQYTRN